MALCHVHWFSQILGKQVGTLIVLPETGTGPFATYYLLHGLTDDYTVWQRQTGIERYVRDLPLIVVMPDGFRGFYTDNEQGPAYTRYIAEELIGFVERNFPAKSNRAGRCIGGLSMGGYGALRVGLSHPQLFTSINSHSGAVMHGQRTYRGKDDAEMRRGPLAPITICWHWRASPNPPADCPKSCWIAAARTTCCTTTERFTRA